MRVPDQSPAPHPASLTAFARENRIAPTNSEARLWLALRRRQLLGVEFRRQVPLGGRYIADFLARDFKLVVEVDGACHEAKRQSDERRDRKLRRLGYRVLRLPAERLMKDLPAALERIREELRLCGR